MSGIARAPRRTRTEGAVYVEFIIAFMPIFTMVLGLIQLALTFTAHLVVQHAAVCAVRAAVVVLPDDPARYNNAPVNTVADGTDSAGDSPIDSFVRLITGGAVPSIPSIPGLSGGLGGMGGGFFGTGSTAGSPQSVYAHQNKRMHDIQDAASMPLLAISPSIQQLAPALFGGHDSILAAIGSNDPAFRAATGALVYNKSAVAVTFPQTPGGTDYRNSFSDVHGPVTARVTYLFHCGVPIVRMWMCNSAIGIRFGNSEQAAAIARSVANDPSPLNILAANSALAALAGTQRAAEAGVAELDSAPWSMLALVTAATGARFKIVRGEATLPLQGANYTYTHASSTGSGAAP